MVFILIFNKLRRYIKLTYDIEVMGALENEDFVSAILHDPTRVISFYFSTKN